MVVILIVIVNRLDLSSSFQSHFLGVTQVLENSDQNWKACTQYRGVSVCANNLDS